MYIDAIADVESSKKNKTNEKSRRIFRLIGYKCITTKHLQPNKNFRPAPAAAVSETDTPGRIPTE